jgi:hypothetical protein
MAAANLEKGTGFNTTAVVLIGAAALVFLFALALFIQGGYLAAERIDFEAKVYNAPGNEAAGAALAEQQALLGEKTRWKDQEKGTVVMPIEDAMEQVVKKANSQ